MPFSHTSEDGKENYKPRLIIQTVYATMTLNLYWSNRILRFSEEEIWTIPSVKAIVETFSIMRAIDCPLVLEDGVVCASCKSIKGKLRKMNNSSNLIKVTEYPNVKYISYLWANERKIL